MNLPANLGRWDSNQHFARLDYLPHLGLSRHPKTRDRQIEAAGTWASRSSLPRPEALTPSRAKWHSGRAEMAAHGEARGDCQARDGGQALGRGRC